MSDKRKGTSHLLQMRGLKLLQKEIMQNLIKSHLLQMRGLKPWNGMRGRSKRRSHLLQMRGLKLLGRTAHYTHYVASFTDAWIETLEKVKTISEIRSRIFYRCVD